MVTAAVKLKDTCSLGRRRKKNKNHDQHRQHVKKQRHYFPQKKVPLVTVMVFPVIKYGCEYWIIKKAESQRIDGFELWFWRRVCKSSNCKEIKPVYPKGNQFWFFIGRTDAEAEGPILWSPDVKKWLTGKDPYAGRLKAEGKGDDRGWDGLMASSTQWAWL